MKTKNTLCILAIFLFFGAFLPQKSSAQVTVNFQTFYDNLSPYGNWITSSDYGYIWVPQTSGFIPYHSNGHWVYTNIGWTWVSDYSWGWAPFHYGRWYYDSFYGWAWVPGTQWGPAWVTWRSTPDYGWAPIAPGITMQVAYSNAYNLPYNQWTFVRDSDFGRSNISNYYVSTTNNVTIIKNTTIINNVRKDKKQNINYHAGPSQKDVKTRTGRTYTPVAINDRKSAGQKVDKNQLELYRPKVNKNTISGKKPAPAKVSKGKNIQPQTSKAAKTGKAQNVKPQNNQTREQQVKQLNNKKAIQQKELQQMNNQKAEKQRQQKLQQAQQQREQNNQKLEKVQQQQMQNNQREKQQQALEQQRQMQQRQTQQQQQQRQTPQQQQPQQQSQQQQRQNNNGNSKQHSNK
jgi:DNA segregation ATPase FtsK/SpoIIIE-like protein